MRLAPGGEIVAEIAMPDGLDVFACMLGGDDGRTLLMCAAPDFDAQARAAAHEAVLAHHHRRRPARRAAVIRYGLLGPAAAWRDGREAELGSPQQRALFALLLLHRNETVSTDRMVDALWPAGAPANALAVLRTYVARLRAGPLGDAAVVTRRGGYELRAPPGAVDADRLEALVAEGRAELERGDASAAEAALRRRARARARPGAAGAARRPSRRGRARPSRRSCAPAPRRSSPRRGSPRAATASSCRRCAPSSRPTRCASGRGGS